VYIDGFLPHFMQKFNEHHRLVYLLCCCLLKLVPEFTRVCFIFVFVFFVGFLCFVLFFLFLFCFSFSFLFYFFLVGERVCSQSLAKCVMNCRKVFVIFLAIALSVPIFTSSNYPLGIFKHSLCPSLEIFL